MKYLLALLIIMGTLAAIRWLRQQQKRIDLFDHFAEWEWEMSA